jgi:hypothetical protein
MTRLYSYLTYISLGLFPIAFIFFAINMNQHFKFTLQYFLSNDLILLIFLSAVIYIYIKFKRVYVKSSELYIYSLFSDKHIILNKQNLVSIGRFIPFDPFSYKIIYADEDGNTKTVYFIKDVFIFNMKNILENLR